MNADLSRRSFLFGSAAVLAAAAIPMVPAVASPSIVPAEWAATGWARREISRILFVPETGKQIPGPDFGVELSVYRRGPGALECPIIRFGVSRHSVWRWSAVSDEHKIIILPDRHALDIEVAPSLPTTWVVLTGADYLTNGEIEHFDEVYAWPGPSRSRVVFVPPVFSEENEYDAEAA